MHVFQCVRGFAGGGGGGKLSLGGGEESQGSPPSVSNPVLVYTTLYVGMAHPAPPTNTNFQITFLLSRLLEALYEDLPV